MAEVESEESEEALEAGGALCVNQGRGVAARSA